MVNKNGIRNIVGIIGNVVSFGLFASPLPTFIKIYKKGAVEEFSPNPYLATIMNCLLWDFYGLPIVHPHSTLVLTINSIGLVMEFSYIFTYLYFATKKQRVYVYKFLGLELVFYMIVIGLTLGLLHTHEHRSMAIGILCVVFNIAMYAMPLDVMKKVITTKSVEYMPFLLSLTNCFNGTVWTTYGLIKFDVYIVTSNGAGVVLGLIQLILYAIYYKSTPVPAKPKEKPQNPELELV
ncbi:hypothetical protein GIB67_004285 [Kingdonia uniflora]|uniref:Bidirectional sugar transporter SWEET n=1 Tax=Kingdonia uniflora TaxID=39325 RepID=A0A7J7MRA5_9MAGN|nr:hypothetical protein GIB67_004285 [Kingdonia uniflora]